MGPEGEGLGLVLVTDGGDGQGRSALAAVRALAAAGYRVAVTVSGRRSLAAASRHCTRAVPVPPASDPGYAAAVRSETATRSYLDVVAASDAALLALGRPVAHLVDKLAMAERAEACGLETVPAVVCAGREELEAAVAGRLPVVVKPVVSRFPARRIERPEDLAGIDGYPVLVQPYVDGTMTAVAGVLAGGAWLGAVHQCYLRTWPVACGTASAAVTVAPDLALEQRLGRLLAGHEGVFQAQFAGGALLDVNPRVYGSLPLAVAAGANLPALHCDHLRGEGIGHTVRARPGVRYRWLEGDLRHLVAGVRARRLTVAAAVRALRPRRGSAHSVESLTDPAPAFARLRHVVGL